MIGMNSGNASPHQSFNPYLTKIRAQGTLQQLNRHLEESRNLGMEKSPGKM